MSSLSKQRELSGVFVDVLFPIALFGHLKKSYWSFACMFVCMCLCLFFVVCLLFMFLRERERIWRCVGGEVGRILKGKW